jgi:superfamily II DNA or RNA helicase
VTFAAGSLVRTRGREWVVMPESVADFLVLRPLGGSDEEITGVLPQLETVSAATFALPDPSRAGDHWSGKLLRDAVRLGFRSSAGPFRSFGNLGFNPRPYQLVPLLMALKLDPIRLLIADDVGIGKTIEAGLIAKELLDRGEATRLAVLCSPQLAEQWQRELHDKFHIDAELVLPSTAARLERDLMTSESLFERHPFVIVSTDFIKSERRRQDFLRACPELVIVDEAHTCVSTMGVSGQQRHMLLKGLSENAARHLILVTATPHSGKEDAFRALLALLDPALAELPDDLAADRRQVERRRLAKHFVQRRRGDIRHYLGADTDFPERESIEKHYALSPEYKKLFDRVVDFARETVRDPIDNKHRERVRWWSVLALLQSMASSPAAAAATMRSRSKTVETVSDCEADEIGRRTVFDLATDESAEDIDVVSGADPAEASAATRLRKFADEADALRGEFDAKLLGAVKIVKDLLKEGFQPIVFCRFIPTAEYLAYELRARLPKNVTIEAVTGLLPPEEREQRVRQLAGAEKRVLIATDCLSEGINLQDGFDAVVHYDLSWNPTRHEQREGRVDRYGQEKPKVRAVTYYGVDNRIDGIVLDVLLRKHKSIRNDLGISVPIPVDGDQLMEAVFEGLLLREQKGLSAQGTLAGFDAFFAPKKSEFHARWDAARDREKKSRSIFAQETIGVDEVAAERQRISEAIGSGTDVESFVTDALRRLGGVVSGEKARDLDVRETPIAIRDAVGVDKLSVVFDGTPRAGRTLLTRTHPVVSSLASHVFESAMDEEQHESIARRSGALFTSKVTTRTTLLVTRMRFHLTTRRHSKTHQTLAEDVALLAFRGAPGRAEWLSDEEAEALLMIEPETNIGGDRVREAVSRIVEAFDELRPALDEDARRRAAALLETHLRVRGEAKLTGVAINVEPQLPVDVLGVYVYLPRQA